MMQKKIPRRAVLKTKDIEIICQKSGRTARRLMQKLKVLYERQPWQFILISEFCEYMGIEENEFWDKLDGALLKK